MTDAEPLRGRVEEMSPEAQAGAGLCRLMRGGVSWDPLGTVLSREEIW